MWPFGKSTNQRFNDAVQSTIEATNACFGPWMANGRLFNAMMTDPYVSCYVMSRMQGLALMTCRMDGVPDDVHQYVLDAAMTKLLGGQRNGRAYVEGAAKFKTDSSTRVVLGRRVEMMELRSDDSSWEQVIPRVTPITTRSNSEHLGLLEFTNLHRGSQARWSGP